MDHENDIHREENTHQDISIKRLHVTEIKTEI